MPPPFYLDDLRVGQRFTSGTRAVNEDEIKSFAREYDPQPFQTVRLSAAVNLLMHHLPVQFKPKVLHRRVYFTLSRLFVAPRVGGQHLEYPAPAVP